jgi:hypothetical protein
MKSYPQESVQSVYERIFEIIEVDNQMKNKFKDAQNLIKELPLENKEVINQLNITQ